MRVAVIGAGVIGVSTAWFLRQQGHEVVVIDRQPGPAQETSFANACQISVSYSEPWATPAALPKLLKWLGRDDAPLLFRPRAELQQWRWGAQFLIECQPQRVRRNIVNMLSLSSYSRQTLQQLRQQLGLQYDQLEKGILRISGEPQSGQGAEIAALMRRFGCERLPQTADGCVQVEPALAAYRDHIAGGDYTPTDESGDVYQFTTQLAERASAAGVRFLFDSQITQLRRQGQRVAGVEYIAADGRYQTLKADAYVLAAGSYSVQLARQVGLFLNIYPTKGYSATLPIIDAAKAPTVSITDDDHKLAISRIGDRLRVAGTAELAGYDRTLNPVRCQALVRRIGELFPGACDLNAAQFWTGLRPSTPSNVPYVGQSALDNLWLNTGHGTLGWTMGAGSGRALADLVSGYEPQLQFDFVGRSRRSDEMLAAAAA
ncbi:MAG: D-amino acid dehydrogenase [Betaproteobacteria bacterium]|nr:D-amino acid dehydrogenase [Betaproteobacteria bacterium]MDE2047453.1 D-amino acid dehydrogenase [Betaproteobacteria bacterium]